MPTAQAGQPEAQPTAVAPGHSPLWGLVRRFGWIAVVLAIAVGGYLFAARRDDSGQITGAGDLSVFDLQVGDCYDLKDAEEELIDDVAAKPCAETHEFEVFFAGEMTGTEFPDDETVVTFVVDQCVPAFDEYVGKTYEASQYDIFPITPSEDSWSDGDRDVICSVFDPINDELTGSLRNSGR